MATFENLKKSLFSEETSEFIEESVKYSSRTEKNSRFMKAKDFNELCKTYIQNNIRNNNLLTDKNNNINIHHAMNAFYMDLDFHMTSKTPKHQEELNNGLLNLFIEGFENVAADKDIEEYYYFPFVANSFTSDEGNKSVKGGSHTMIICNKLFSKQEREEIYDSIIDYVVKNHNNRIQLKKIVGYNQNGSIKDLFISIFDKQPIKTANLLMPFAQKEASSRQYRLLKEKMTYKNQNWFILDVEQKEKDEIEIDEGEMTKEMLNDDISPDVMLNPYNVLCREAKLIYDFVSSFKYLSNTHKIWDKLFSEHGDYYYNFVDPYYKMLLMLNLFNSNNYSSFFKYTDNNGNRKRYDPFIMIGKIVARQLTNLCHERPNVKSYKGRYDYQNQYKNIENMIITKLKYEWNDDKVFNEYVEENELDPEDRPDINISKFNTPIKLYFFIKEYDSNPSKKNKSYIKAIGDYRPYFVANSEIWTRLITMFRSIVNKFIKNIIYVFKDNISNEIEPFNKTKSYTHQVCYKDDNATFKEPLSFYDVDPTFAIGCDYNHSKERDETYVETIKCWITILLAFMLYNVDFQLQEAIKHTLGPFIKKYIVIIPTQAAGNNRNTSGEKVLVYNVRQTIELEKYPYNQWLGNATNMIQKWLNKLYDNYIAKSLSTVEKDTGVKLLLDSLINNKIVSTPFAARAIKPLAHADKDITEMQRNIISFHNTESSAIPENILIETSEIFPMRNGWLHFEPKNKEHDAKTTFTRDNRDKYLGSGTNIPYVGDVDDYKKYIETNKEAKEAYDSIELMIKQIYPVDDEREYNMRIFSSVLYGIGSKNILHVMFGTGSDGKTTIMNALFGMLDAQGFTSDVHIKENGRNIEVCSIRGLAETMNADTLLVSNKPGSHDEGGRACIAHMRLVSVQEPDQHMNNGQLNGAVIKELTSGGAISARKIYGESESVQANALITFQTNTCPGTDDTSYGFRRRLSMYTHRSKFYPSIDMEKGHMKYKYEQKTSLGENLKRNLYYKQAMFYYLLPYALKNLNEDTIDLQHIPKPKVVQDGIYQVINKSTGISKWLAEYITEYDEEKDTTSGIINIAALVELMIEENGKKNEKLWGRTRNSNAEVNMIITTLQNNFENSIYRLKGEYYKKYESGRRKLRYEYNDLKNFITNIGNPKTRIKDKTMTCSELKKKYLKENSVNDATKTKLTAGYEDLFIVGFTYNDISINSNSCIDEEI